MIIKHNVNQSDKLINVLSLLLLHVFKTSRSGSKAHTNTKCMRYIIL